MIADVVEMSPYEGGPWLTWPCKAHVKPSNPELLLPRAMNVRNNRAYWHDSYSKITVIFHAIRLSDGAEWAVINGFRRLEDKRPH